MQGTRLLETASDFTALQPADFDGVGSRPTQKLSGYEITTRDSGGYTFLGLIWEDRCMVEYVDYTGATRLTEVIGVVEVVEVDITNGLDRHKQWQAPEYLSFIEEKFFHNL